MRVNLLLIPPLIESYIYMFGNEINGPTCSLRPINLIGDPKWSRKEFLSPYSVPIDLDPIDNAIQFLASPIANMRLGDYKDPCLDNHLDDPAALVAELQAQAALVDTDYFAQMVQLPMSHLKFPAKLRECRLRWQLIISNWRNSIYSFIPFGLDIISRYYTSYQVAPSNRS